MPDVTTVSRCTSGLYEIRIREWRAAM
jgi:hypothetical protein